MASSVEPGLWDTEGRKEENNSQHLSFPLWQPIMDITDIYCADLNELNAPDSPSLKDLKIEVYGTSFLLLNLSTTMVAYDLIITFRSASDQ